MTPSREIEGDSSGNHTPYVCSFRNGECDEYATQKVRTVLGVEEFCDSHAWIVRQIEAEWDQAESEMFDQ